MGNIISTSDPFYHKPCLSAKDEKLVDELMGILMSASNYSGVKLRVTPTLYPNKWTEPLAIAVVHRLVRMIENNALMGPAATGALILARTTANIQLAPPDPVFVYDTIRAIGVLMGLAPQAVEALGYSDLNIKPGTAAARWQSKHSKHITQEGLITYLDTLNPVEGPPKGFEWTR